MARPTLLCALLAATAHAIRSNGNPRPMPRSQPTTLETLRGHDPFIDIRGGGVFDDPADEPEEDDVDARMRPPYASPLYVAAAGGYGACVAEILAHGGTAPAARGDHGPLHAAACSGDVECIARILAADAGALERRDPEARTPLAKAVQNSRVDAAVFLVICGARPVYADAPEVGSADDVPVVDGAARAAVGAGGRPGRVRFKARTSAMLFF